MLLIGGDNAVYKVLIKEAPLTALSTAANKLKHRILCIVGVIFKTVFDKKVLAFMAISW